MDARYPRGRSTIHLVTDTARIPTPEGREGLARLLALNGDRLAAIATVFLSHGFQASALRSVSTSIRIEAAKGVEMHHFDGVRGVADWLPAPHEKRTGTRLERDALARILNEIATALQVPEASSAMS
jgi:hypothetical protein